MRETSGFEKILSAAVSVAAVVLAGSVAYRVFVGAPSASSRPAAQSAPILVPRWEEIVSEGVAFGDADAPITLIAFSDFECPACRRFEGEFAALDDSLRNQVKYVFLHLPLSYHRFAQPAAIAFECANRQGRGIAMRQTLYALQDSLGLVQWWHIAGQAGVEDSVAFAQCIQLAPDAPRIASNSELGARIGAHGTPTVIINGWKLSQTPSRVELAELIGVLRKGGDPSTRP